MNQTQAERVAKAIETHIAETVRDTLVLQTSGGLSLHPKLPSMGYRNALVSALTTSEAPAASPDAEAVRLLRAFVSQWDAQVWSKGHFRVCVDAARAYLSTLPQQENA